MGVFLFICAVSASAANGVAAGTGRIEGTVGAEGGAPLAEVWVCAYLAQSEEFEEHCDFTGSDGIYAIQGLKAGNYKVEFWPEATEPSYVGEFYDNEELWEEADEVEVEESVATTGIDAELATGATIKGEVRAATLGGPLGQAAAVVCAQRPSGESIGCALTKSDGTYLLPGLPSGEYKVQFVPASNIYNLLNQFYDHKSEWPEADALDVVAGETKIGVDADLEPGAEIKGTVYSATSGSPVAGVSACALFYEGILEAWLPAHCVPTSSSGTFELFALWSDTYRVVFSADLNEIFGEGPHKEDGYFAQYFDGKPTLAAADPLPLNAPEVITGIDGHLQPKPTASISTPLVTPPAIASPKRSRIGPLRCRPGFRRKRVGGKKRCVKIHKHRRHHRKHGKV
jgi:hypothetical protein